MMMSDDSVLLMACLKAMLIVVGAAVLLGWITWTGAKRIFVKADDQAKSTGINV